MLDPVNAGLHATALRSAAAPALVLAAGIVSSIGPCVAPRFIAVAGLAAHRSRGDALRVTAAFVSGLCAAYIAFGLVGSLVGRAASVAHLLYAAVAIALLCGGITALWRERTPCTHPAEGPRAGVSFGAAFCLGVSCAFVISPCCTPMLFGIIAYASNAGDPVYAALLLGLFALGHSAPVLAVGVGVSSLGGLLERIALRRAADTVSATLMIALAGYYAVLA